RSSSSSDLLKALVLAGRLAYSLGNPSGLPGNEDAAPPARWNGIPGVALTAMKERRPMEPTPTECGGASLSPPGAGERLFCACGTFVTYSGVSNSGRKRSKREQHGIVHAARTGRVYCPEHWGR